MRAVRPFLFWGFASLTTLAAFAKRKRPSVGRYFQRQRVSPRAAAPLCENCPRIRPNKAVGAAARRFGLAFAPQQRLYPSSIRAQERVRCSSQLGG